MPPIKDESTILNVQRVARESDSLHVDGVLLSAQGKERKLRELFMEPAKIKTVYNKGRSYLVLRHPGAKVVFERPYGTAWFTCRHRHDQAMQRATNLKIHWENVFKDRAAQYGGAKLCLSPSGHCPACSHGVWKWYLDKKLGCN